MEQATGQLDPDRRVDLNKWDEGGVPFAADSMQRDNWSATPPVTIRCQAFKNAYYACAAKTHIDLQESKCQSYWLDARECFFERRMVEKMKVLELMKAQRLKEVGFSRNIKETIFDDRAHLFQKKQLSRSLGKRREDYNEKVDVKINDFN